MLSIVRVQLFFCGEQPIEIIDKYLWCYPPYTQIHHEGYGTWYRNYFPIVFLSSNQKNSSLRKLFMLLLLIAMVLYSFGNKWKIAHVQIFEFEPIDIHGIVVHFRSTDQGRRFITFFVLLL